MQSNYQDASRRTSTIEAFERIRVFQRGEQRAVHKPLLLLYELGRLARGEPRLIEFAALDVPFKNLLIEFGPSSAPASRHYPFWHLATDGKGTIWELKGPSAVLNRPPAATPTLTELRSRHVEGGFTSELHARLRSDPTLRDTVARLLLDAHFPESLHADILQAVGLETAPQEAQFTTDQEAASRRRDPEFRKRVLRAYEYRCCVCGFDLRIGQMTAGLEAAHIQWFQANGPDVESNGLALCALHHKIFDLGVFTLDPESLTLVFSQNVAMSDSTRKLLLSYHGAGIILPQSKTYYPDASRLAWHAQWVFKKPGREI